MDERAVIEQHLPLVRHIVFQVAVGFPRHVDREELARAGTLGLVEAARRFEPGRGVPFARFAARRIRGAMLDAVRTADWAPRSVRNSARSIDEASQELVARLGRRPTLDELAAALDTTTEELARLQHRIHRSVVLALDQHLGVGDGADTTLGDTVTDHEPGPGEVLERRELHAYVRDAVRLLPERQRLVIIGYFLDDRSSAELARFLGVTESRVSQLRSEGLRRLREAIGAQYDDEGAGSGLVGGPGALAAALRDSSTWRERLRDAEPDQPRNATNDGSMSRELAVRSDS